MKKIGSLFSLFLILALGLSAQPTWLDSGFGRQGMFVQDSLGVNSMIVLHDGKILLGGFDRSFALLRLLNDGFIDSSFGKNGFVFTPHAQIMPRSEWGTIQSIAEQTDHKILAAGLLGHTDALMEAIPDSIYVIRYNTDGAIDSSFGRNGMMTANFDGYLPRTSICHIETGNAGKIYLSRLQNLITDNYTYSIYCGVMCIDSTGRIDSTYGVNGRTFAPPSLTPFMLSSALQGGAKVLIGGSDSTKSIFSIIRFNPFGSIDSSFGVNGIAGIHRDTDDRGGFNSLYVQSDGKIIATEYLMPGSSSYFKLIRFTSSGLIDSTFGDNGYVKTIFPLPASPHLNSYALFIKQFGNGKTLVGGNSSLDTLRGNYALSFARYLSNGNLDSSFGINGLLVTNKFNEYMTSMAVQNDDKFLACTYSSGQVLRYLSSPNVGIIDFALDDHKLYIYPNPMRGSEILVYTLTTAESISISLLGMDGRLITTYAENEKQNAGEHKQPIVIPDSLPAGAYIISIASQSGTVAVRVVK